MTIRRDEVFIWGLYSLETHKKNVSADLFLQLFLMANYLVV
jgi:hypothetical protein